MATEIDTVRLHRGDRARGVDGSVALNKNHSGHVAGNETPIIRPRRRRAALRRNETVALQLIRELLEGARLEAGKNQRRFDGLESGARRQPSSLDSFALEPELLCGGLRCGMLGGRVQHVLNGRNPGHWPFRIY